MSLLILLAATLSGGAVGALITRAYYTSLMNEAAKEILEIADMLKPQAE